MLFIPINVNVAYTHICAQEFYEYFSTNLYQLAYRLTLVEGVFGQLASACHASFSMDPILTKFDRKNIFWQSIL